HRGPHTRIQELLLAGSARNGLERLLRLRQPDGIAEQNPWRAGDAQLRQKACDRRHSHLRRGIFLHRQLRGHHSGALAPQRHRGNSYVAGRYALSLGSGEIRGHSRDYVHRCRSGGPFSAGHEAPLAMVSRQQHHRVAHFCRSHRSRKLLHAPHVFVLQSVRRHRGIHHIFDMGLHRQPGAADRCGSRESRAQRRRKRSFGLMSRIFCFTCDRRLRIAPFAGKFLLLFFWSSFLVFAQQQQPTSYAGFEGRKVETVDVSATPLMDVTSFRAMIRQKAGQPFSQAAVRESITALQNTKLFSSVKLNVTPQQNGLKLVFVLEPAYYVGHLSFPGAIQAFPYTRLLQSANIPPQSAFTNDLPPQGQKALQHFFQTNGYFLASVAPKAGWDQPHMIVNLTFACDLKKLAKIGAIDIEGVPPPEAQKLRRAMDSLWAELRRTSLKSGQKYSIHRIYQGVAHIRAKLADEGRLAPTVRFASANYDPQTNRALLTFQVVLGPKVSVQVTGAHLWKRTQKRLIPIYQESDVDEDLIYEGRLNILNYMQSKGYFDASVQAQVARDSELT